MMIHYKNKMNVMRQLQFQVISNYFLKQKQKQTKKENQATQNKLVYLDYIITVHHKLN